MITEGQAADEYAGGAAGRYEGTDQDYQTVATWTVTTDRIGELKEIMVLSDDYELTEFKVVVDGVTWAEDWIMLSSMPLMFEDLRLAADAVVTVSARSTDGTSIIVDAIIVGKEVAE